MLKGVSQKVIEVVHTDNRYFEKAILFLRPGSQGEDKTLLKNQAGEYLSQIDYRPQGKDRPRTAFFEIIEVLVSALLGAGIACAFLLF